MSFIAAWGVHDEHDPRAGVRVTITTPEQVDSMVEQLAMDTSEAAKIIHDARSLSYSVLAGEMGPDHQLWAGIWQGYGYLMYADDDHELCQPVGDPDSPVYHSDSDQYEAGTGVAIETFTKALKEFLATAQRPTCVEWREVL